MPALCSSWKDVNEGMGGMDHLKGSVLPRTPGQTPEPTELWGRHEGKGACSVLVSLCVHQIFRAAAEMAIKDPYRKKGVAVTSPTQPLNGLRVSHRSTAVREHTSTIPALEDFLAEPVAKAYEGSHMKEAIPFPLGLPSCTDAGDGAAFQHFPKW